MLKVYITKLPNALFQEPTTWPKKFFFLWNLWFPPISATHWNLTVLKLVMVMAGYDSYW